MPLHHFAFYRMGSAVVQMACVALGVVGLIGIVVCCAVPLWRVSAFTGSNIVTAEVIKHMCVVLYKQYWIVSVY